MKRRIYIRYKTLSRCIGTAFGLAAFGCSTGTNGDIAAKQLNVYYYEKCCYSIR